MAPLHYAASTGNISMMEMFLDTGAGTAYVATVVFARPFFSKLFGVVSLRVLTCVEKMFKLLKPR